MKVDVKITGSLTDKFGKFKKKFKPAARKAMRESIDELHAEIRKNVSMPAHSKEELRKLGHPFASRHSSILPHGHLPLWSVHAEYGVILKGLNKKTYEQKNGVIGEVGWFNPYGEIEWVIMGTDFKTRKGGMEKRPVHKLTAQDINFGEKLFNKFKKNLAFKENK